MNKLSLALAGCFALGMAMSPVLGGEAFAFPKGDGAWTVEIERVPPSSGTGREAPPFPVRYEIQRQGDIRRDRIGWSSGATTERWWYTGSPPLLMETGLTGGAFYYSPNESTAASSFDASMFAWLASATPAGEEKMKGKTCAVFRGEVQDGESRESRKAWIARDSGRPVALEAGGSLIRFAFQDAPPEKLEPPAELVRRAERARKIIGVK